MKYPSPHPPLHSPLSVARVARIRKHQSISVAMIYVCIECHTRSNDRFTKVSHQSHASDFKRETCNIQHCPFLETQPYFTSNTELQANDIKNIRRLIHFVRQFSFQYFYLHRIGSISVRHIHVDINSIPALSRYIVH